MNKIKIRIRLEEIISLKLYFNKTIIRLELELE